MNALRVALLPAGWMSCTLGCDLALGLADYEGSGVGGAATTTTATTAGGGGLGGGEGGDGGEGGASPSYVQVVLADQPVAYWRLDDLTSVDVQTAVDLSDNHFDGSYEGTILHDEQGLTADDNAGISLSGAPEDRVNVGDVLDYPLNASFTVEAWVRPTDADDGSIVQKRDGAGGWRLSLLADNTHFRRDVIGVGGQEASGPRIPTGVVSHVVGRYDGSEICLFVDAVEIDCRNSGVALIDGMASLTLGQSLTGALDEVAIYSVALDDERITAHYEAGAPVQR